MELMCNTRAYRVVLAPHHEGLRELGRHFDWDSSSELRCGDGPKASVGDVAYRSLFYSLGSVGAVAIGVCGGGRGEAWT